MRVISVNVGKTQPINAKSGKTGIYKEPVSTPVAIHTNGVEGDVIIDVANHGGVDQAVYIYGMPDYAWWSQQLDQALMPATFGENITIESLESATLCIGDRLHMGTVILEVTAPRIPCVTLAQRMGDPKFVKKFLQSKRYGAYCRVIQEGKVQAGDDVTLTPYSGEKVGINELVDAFTSRHRTQEQLQRFLSVPIAIRARNDYETQLGE